MRLTAAATVSAAAAARFLGWFSCRLHVNTLGLRRHRRNPVTRNCFARLPVFDFPDHALDDHRLVAQVQAQIIIGRLAILPGQLAPGIGVDRRQHPPRLVALFDARRFVLRAGIGVTDPQLVKNLAVFVLFRLQDRPAHGQVFVAVLVGPFCLVNDGKNVAFVRNRRKVAARHFIVSARIFCAFAVAQIPE